ncbi:MAG TPA: lycopene cyclase domain-containing protein [Flavobacteriia bacterium]|nr:lycopene cyclase domain-containing protein [Flavobacteriia bacterium]
MKSLYLILNLGSFLIPFIYSFNKKMNFIRYIAPLFVSITIIAIPYIIWDIWFTKLGVWGFNPKYYLGFTFFHIPIEEYLFFFCIPYASVFIHYALEFFFPNLVLHKKYTNLLTVLLIGLSLFIALTNLNKLYTSSNFFVFALALIFGFLCSKKSLSRFYISYLVILIPFILVNGILTGSIIKEPIVWYNNAENLGIRFGTIPIEDFAYAFSLLYFVIFTFEILKNKSTYD